MSKTTWDRIVTGDELKRAKRERNTPFYTKTIFRSSLEGEAENGWEFLSDFKNPKKVKVKKDKTQDEVFEDTVWMMFANLGFSAMNRDKHFIMSYGPTSAQTQQVDVFAVDEETIVFVECKSAQKLKDGVFKKEIEALGAKMNGKEFNNESIDMMRKIESAVKKYVRKKLEEQYGGKWINEIPQAVYTAASKDASKHRYETGEDKDFWDFITIIGCKDIVVFGKNWSEIFEKKFTLPSELKKSGGKQAKVEWMVLIDKLQRRAIKSNFTVAKSEYQTLGEAYQQFVDIQ